MHRPRISSAALILAVGFLVLFVGGGARFAIGLTLKPIVDEFGWVRADIGGAVALFQVMSAAAMFFAGLAADRINPRRVLAGGLIAAAVGIAAMALMSEPWHALVLYGVVFALGNGAASGVPVGVLVTRAYPQRTGIANAVVGSGMSVGQLVMIAALTAVLAAIGWRSVYVWLGIAHLALVPLLLAAVPATQSHATPAPRRDGPGIAAAARGRQFWLLIAIYAICGFDDFFVSTHVVAFAQDRGVDAFLAGNLLAVMGLTGLVGIILAGAWSDRAGPVWPVAFCFAARIGAFALVLFDQSPLSVTVYALVFGVTFMMTAPLVVVFVVQNFGVARLGAFTGLITMVHHMCGGIGAYLGARIFDQTGTYDIAYAVMLIASAVALALCLMLRRTTTA
jgi:predicted MFS family arabinose efflux permease